MSLSDEIAAQAAQTPEARRKTLGALADLLERSGIDIADVGAVRRVNAWQALTKNPDGEAELHDLVGIQFSPTWETGPEWPVIQPAAPTVVRPLKPRSARPELRTTMVMPDPQIGYLRLDGELVPTHDEQAIAVALQIARAVRPDHLVNIGDLLDLPEWSGRFVVSAEMVQTTQPALDRAHLFLAEQRALCDRVSLLAGNHDARMTLALTRNAMAAVRLRKANVPGSWPVLSVPYLLRLDELGVEYVGAYPAGRLEIATGGGRMTPLIAVHGEKLDMAKVARSERQSVVQGHTHRLALHSETYEVRGEPETVTAIAAGCLCRIDGHVPSTRGGVDEFGRPARRWEAWQQGVVLIHETAGGYWAPELVPIHGGRALYRGRLYEA